MKENIIAAVAVVALIMGGWALFKGPAKESPSQTFGATAASGMLAENYIPYVMYNGGYNSAKDLNITGGVTFGSSGTTFTSTFNGTCNPTQMTIGSQAASSSAQFFCAVSGVQNGDRVFASLPVGAGANPSGNSSTYGGFVLNSAVATTSGIIGFEIANLTGAATTSFVQATTGVQYWVIR